MSHLSSFSFRNGYSPLDFSSQAQHGTQGSFGGRLTPDQPIRRTPVLFIHGNADGALAVEEADSQDWNQGWSTSIQHFMQEGSYSEAELYAITYGDRELKNALNK